MKMKTRCSKKLKSSFEAGISKFCLITLKNKKTVFGILLNRSRNTNKAILMTPEKDERGHCIEKTISLKNIRKIIITFPKEKEVK
jgi:hypothetical protein